MVIYARCTATQWTPEDTISVLIIFALCLPIALHSIRTSNMAAWYGDTTTNVVVGHPLKAIEVEFDDWDEVEWSHYAPVVCHEDVATTVKQGALMLVVEEHERHLPKTHRGLSVRHMACLLTCFIE